MRQIRQQRLGSYQYNKENEGGNTNLPSLKNLPGTKLAKKQDYHLHLNDRKKTFLNLYSKKEEGFRINLKKDTIRSKASIETTRLGSDNSMTLSSQVSGTFMSSRMPYKEQKRQKGEKKVLKTPSKNNQPEILRNHQINGRARAKMVDWLLQISQAYNLCGQTFFLAVYLMDSYFKNCQKSLSVKQLHNIGVTSIFIATKYQQIHPISLKTVVRDIGHGKITKTEIIDRQSEILQAINFEFSRDCNYLISRQIVDGFITSFQNGDILNKRINYFTKLSVFDADILRGNSGIHLAKGAILAAIRSMQLQNRSQNLDMYDNFITICGRDYQKSHLISGDLMLLQANFKNQYGTLENIQKLSPTPFKNKSHSKPTLAPMMESYAL